MTGSVGGSTSRWARITLAVAGLAVIGSTGAAVAASFQESVGFPHERHQGLFPLRGLLSRVLCLCPVSRRGAGCGGRLDPSGKSRHQSQVQSPGARPGARGSGRVRPGLHHLPQPARRRTHVGRDRGPARDVLAVSRSDGAPERRPVRHLPHPAGRERLQPDHHRGLRAARGSRCPFVPRGGTWPRRGRESPEVRDLPHGRSLCGVSRRHGTPGDPGAGLRSGEHGATPGRRPVSGASHPPGRGMARRARDPGFPGDVRDLPRPERLLGLSRGPAPGGHRDDSPAKPGGRSRRGRDATRTGEPRVPVLPRCPHRPRVRRGPLVRHVPRGVILHLLPRGSLEAVWEPATTQQAPSG
jgi:hypothetical protein